MFSSFMTNAWIGGTVVAVLAGAVGFFVVLRGASFAAHAIPNGAFAGAAGANLVGVNPLFGLVAFALLAALGIGASGRRDAQRRGDRPRARPDAGARRGVPVAQRRVRGRA